MQKRWRDCDKTAKSNGTEVRLESHKKATSQLCRQMNEEARKKVFDEFWQRMNWAQRKQYVAEQVDCDPLERSQSRRSVSLRYHLMVDGERRQVCKNMFQSSLGIGEWSVLSWAQKRATKENEANENRLEKRQTVVPQWAQQKPASSAVSLSVEVTQGECLFFVLSN